MTGSQEWQWQSWAEFPELAELQFLLVDPGCSLAEKEAGQAGFQSGMIEYA